MWNDTADGVPNSTWQCLYVVVLVLVLVLVWQYGRVCMTLWRWYQYGSVSMALWCWYQLWQDGGVGIVYGRRSDTAEL